MSPEVYAETHSELPEHSAVSVKGPSQQIVYVFLDASMVILKWIQNHGGKITARDLGRNRRDVATSENAERILMRLVDNGFGTWQWHHKTRLFVVEKTDGNAIDTSEHSQAGMVESIRSGIQPND